MVDASDIGVSGVDVLLKQEVDEAFYDYIKGLAVIDNGELVIGDWIYDIGSLLEDVDPSAFQAMKITFDAEQIEALATQVVISYPLPIAHFVFLASSYAETSKHRLDYLRAAWEATIRLVHAICIAELRGARVQIKSTDSISNSDLYTDKIAMLIRNIENLTKVAVGNRIGGFVSQIEPDTLSLMRELNNVRNSVSHFQSVTEIQAGSLLQDAEVHFWPLMRRLRRLAEISIVRCVGVVGTDLRLERFKGNTTIPPRQNQRVTPSILMESYSQSPPLFDTENLLVEVDGSYFCLTPFVHFKPANDGMAVQLYLLRQDRVDTGEKCLVFDVVGGDNDVPIPRQQFLTHLNAIRGLFNLDELS